MPFFYTHTNLIVKFVYLFNPLARKMYICVMELLPLSFPLRIRENIFLSVEGRHHSFACLLFKFFSGISGY